MNLKKSDDPRRLLTWRGKSLLSCSKDELMEAVIHLTQQVSIQAQQNKAIIAEGKHADQKENIPSNRTNRSYSIFGRRLKKRIIAATPHERSARENRPPR